MKLAIVSGGMDSVTMLYELKNEVSHVLNFVYGSKHNARETIWAEYHADKLGKPFFKIDLQFIGNYFKSNLLQSGGEIPEGHYEDESMKQTVVPFRNGIMLSIAAGLAESLGCHGVAIANHFGDHAIYPDCRASFVEPMAKAIAEGTWERLVLFAPYTTISKRDIALKGQTLGVPYEKTYSCYKGRDLHCGRCGTCVERREALEGFDPTTYFSELHGTEAP